MVETNLVTTTSLHRHITLLRFSVGVHVFLDCGLEILRPPKDLLLSSILPTPVAQHMRLPDMAISLYSMSKPCYNYFPMLVHTAVTGLHYSLHGSLKRQ